MTTSPRRLKELYDTGCNISAYLREESGSGSNLPAIIEASYDLQAGSYVQSMEDAESARFLEYYAAEIARTIKSLGESSSILEAGVGEATTFEAVLRHLDFRGPAHGFDLSWSRIAHADKWLREHGRTETVLCTGDLLAIPYLDRTFDLVYTSHAIEPNGGRETAILSELMRVSRKHLVLLEPSWELASEEARQRMHSHGYCRGLVAKIQELGGEIIEHRLLAESCTPLNPTAIIVVRLQHGAPNPTASFACPRFRCGLDRVEGGWFSPEALAVYPKLGGFPCLRSENAITASAYPMFRPFNASSI